MTKKKSTCDYPLIKSITNTIHFFFYKNKRYSFIQIDRVHQYNNKSKFAKNKNDESVNKLTTSMLIA